MINNNWAKERERKKKWVSNLRLMVLGEITKEEVLKRMSIP